MARSRENVMQFCKFCMLESQLRTPELGWNTVVQRNRTWVGVYHTYSTEESRLHFLLSNIIISICKNGDFTVHSSDKLPNCKL